MYTSTLDAKGRTVVRGINHVGHRNSSQKCLTYDSWRQESVLPAILHTHARTHARMRTHARGCAHAPFTRPSPGCGRSPTFSQPPPFAPSPPLPRRHPHLPHCGCRPRTCAKVCARTDTCTCSQACLHPTILFGTFPCGRTCAHEGVHARGTRALTYTCARTRTHTQARTHTHTYSRGGGGGFPDCHQLRNKGHGW